MTRVWLRELPRLLHDILAHALTREPGVELLTESDVSGPSSRVPDVIVGADGADDPAWMDVALQRWPRSRVLLIGNSGHQVSLIELRPHRTPFGEMALEEIVGVVTRVALERRRTSGSRR